MRMLHQYYYSSSNGTNNDSHLLDRRALGTVSAIRTLPCIIHEKPSFLGGGKKHLSKVVTKFDRFVPPPPTSSSSSSKEDRVITNPPASIFATCGDEEQTKKIVIHRDDSSDTCSEMTLSATFSNSSSASTCTRTLDKQVGCVFVANGSLEGRDTCKTVATAGATTTAGTTTTTTSTEKSISGKMMGLTLKETMEWRRRVSTHHGNDVDKCFDKKKVSAVHSNKTTYGSGSDSSSNVLIQQEHETCPEFMIVRSQLKSTKSTRNRFTTSAITTTSNGGSSSSNWSFSRGTMMGGATKRNVLATISNSTISHGSNTGQDKERTQSCISSKSSSTYTSDQSRGTSSGGSSSGRSSSGSNGRITLLENSVSTLAQSSCRNMLVNGEDETKTFQGSRSCLQENDIQKKLNALFAARQKHVATAIDSYCDGSDSKRNTIRANGNANVNTNGNGNGKNVTDLKEDFKFKLNAVFAQRIPSKVVGNHRVMEKGSTTNNTDQCVVGLDSLEMKKYDTPEKDLQRIKHTKEQCRIASHGTMTSDMESRDDNVAHDVIGDERDSEPQSVNCEKYQKMLKLGLPEGAVRHAMTKDGIDPSVLFSDNVVHQRSCSSDNTNKKDSFRRIRLHWDTIPEENVSQGCIWHEIALDTEIGNLTIEEQEFNTLFQCEVLSLSVLSPRNDCSTERVVKVIDPKRANNGGIILARLKMSYDDIATGIATMNDSILTPQQIIGIMEFIPSEEERKSLGNYIRSGKDSSTLCECEKFMLAIMPVQAAKKKLEAMLFKLQYPNSVKQLYQDIETLSMACDNILESVKLRKILGVILKVGNRLNLAGMESIKTSASGFTIELLTKLNQVRALDRRTSILQYIVSVIERWNAPLLDIKEELKYVLRTKKIADYESSLCSLENQLNTLVRTAILDDHDGTCTDIGANPNLKDSAVGQFVLNATETICDLHEKHVIFKEKFNEVVVYLAQDETTKPDKLFGAISIFCDELDSALQSNRNKHKYQKI